MRNRKGWTLFGLLITIIAIIFIVAFAQSIMIKLAFSLLTSRLVLVIIGIACIAFVIGKALKK